MKGAKYMKYPTNDEIFKANSKEELKAVMSHMARNNITKKEAADIEIIAKEVLGVDTLEQRNSDSLDFYDIGVSSLKEALARAYKAGQKAAAKK